LTGEGTEEGEKEGLLVGRILAINQVIVLIGAIIRILVGRRSHPLSSRRVAESFLLWSLPLNVGVNGLWAFLGHTLKAKETAEEIGWPAGNPFQTEVAVTNLAFGILGLLCARFRGRFWLATAIGQGVFLWGASAVHAREMIKARNFNPGNAGPVFFFDVLVPVVHLGLLSAYDKPETGRKRRLR
jgi:hypothetical protein